MNPVVQVLLFVVLGYLLGTIPTGYLVGRLRGIDVRAVGSGNIGATNVLRAVGPWAAIVVVIVDPLKGVAAVALPAALGVDLWIVAATALATVLGNTYNVFLRFRGGKGVATSVGVFMVVDPLVTVLAIALFAIVLWTARYVSLASVVGVAVAPLLVLARGSDLPVLLLAFAVAAVVIVRHADNIGRLRAGVERRLGERGPPPAGVAAAPGTNAAPGSTAPRRGRRRR
jgi:acyl phosphate:glycerol-3-phosphate acyltransferase